MEETKELIFKSMREASEYFGFPYSGKTSKRDRKYLDCYCKWEKVSKKQIKVLEIYDEPKEFEVLCCKQYKYQVGDIISSTNSSFRVLKQIRMERQRMVRGKKEITTEKGYLVKCVKDGYEFEIFESNIPKNYGCPVCSNRKIVKGINDVATTHPDIAALFENIEDAYTTSYSTAKKFRFKCPKCGGIKIDCTNNITTNGFSCPHCSDGVSYPNKFMAKLLNELKIDFDREVRFDWCKYPCFIDETKLDYGSYDFVIPEMNIIIEADGGLGHGKNVMTTIRHNRRKITVEETAYRDKMKDKLAIENGYKIIRIDCFYHNLCDRFDIIVKNIKESDLANIFDLSNINFESIDYFCLTNSYVIDVVELWNNGLTVAQIEKEMKLSLASVSKYLKICTKLGLCDYSREKSHRRSIDSTSKRSPYSVSYNNRIEVFSSYKELREFYEENYGINICRETLRRHINDDKLFYNRIFKKITKEEFNKYYNDRSLADLVVGEAFLIA